MLDRLPQREFEREVQRAGERGPLAVDVRGRHEDLGHVRARVAGGRAGLWGDLAPGALDEGRVRGEVEQVRARGHGRDDGRPAGDRDAELVHVVVRRVVLRRVDAGDVEAVLPAAQPVLGVLGREGEAEDGAVRAREADAEGERLRVGDDFSERGGRGGLGVLARWRQQGRDGGEDAGGEVGGGSEFVKGQVFNALGGEDLADLDGELLGTHEAVPVDVLFQDVVFEAGQFGVVEAEARVLEDVLDNVVREQAGHELRSTVAFGEQLSPSVLASVGDVGAVGDEFWILV